MIIPSTFAMGTATKKYRSLTVDTKQYTGFLDLEPTAQPSAHDLARAQSEPFLDLLNQSNPGPLFVETQGKLMVPAAGNVNHDFL